MHAQLLASHSCLPMQSSAVKKGPLTQSMCARHRSFQEKEHRHMQEVPISNPQIPPQPACFSPASLLPVSSLTHLHSCLVSAK